METSQIISFTQKTFQEKKDFIIKAIVDGYKTRSNKDNDTFNLRIRFHEGLTDQDLDDVAAILHALEKKDNVIIVESFDYPTPLITGGAKSTTPRYDLLVRLKITKDIQSWYSAYLYEKNQKLEDLDPLQLENIYNTVLDIEERLRIKPSTQVTIKLNQECRFPLLDEKCDGLLHSAEFRKDALTFLARKNVITAFKINDPDDADTTVTLTINFDKFQNFKVEIADVYTLKIQSKPALIINLPPNTNWEGISLRFIDGNNVEIKSKDFKQIVHFKDMGFEDKRTRRPDKQWELLQYLAENAGQISWDSSLSNVKVKKKKQRLSKTLQEYFQITEDPFFPYKSEEAYTTRIQFHT